MTKTPLQPPTHDTFFKVMMQNVQIAREFFQMYLPQPLLAQADLSTLQIRPVSFINQDLKTHYSDMIYSLDFQGKPGYFYNLIEHKYQASWLTAFQCLKYQISLMDWHVTKLKHQELPIVYTMIYYHGKTPFPYPLDPLDLFADRDLAEQYMFKPFRLIDLRTISDEEILSQPHTGAMMIVMKYIHEPDGLLKKIDQVAEACQNFMKINHFPQESLRSILFYLLGRGNITDKKFFLNYFNNYFSEMENEMKTIAEQWKEEGREEIQKKIMIFVERFKQQINGTSQNDLTKKLIEELEQTFKSHEDTKETV